MCSSTVSKFLLIIINIVFLLLGLVLFVLGCIAKFSQSLLLKMMSAIPGDTMDDILEAWDLGEFLGNAAVIIIIIGFCLLLVGVFGCCGAIKEASCMLWGYAVIVGLVIIIQIAAAVLIQVQSAQVEAMVNDVLTRSLSSSYTDEKGGIDVENGTMKLATDPSKLAWDGAQIMMDCCGVQNGSEYQGFFNGKYDFGTGPIAAKVPLSCCKAISIEKYTEGKDGQNASVSTAEALSINTCLTQGASSTETHQTGCYDAFIGIIKGSWTMYAVILVVVMLIEIIGLVSACIVIRNSGKGYNEM